MLDLTQFEGHSEDPQLNVIRVTATLEHNDQFWPDFNLLKAAPELLAEVKRLREALVDIVNYGSAYEKLLTAKEALK